MAWHLVDGLRIPDAVGGHPALDFCNTRTGWGGARPKEYLIEPRVLAVWCADVGLLPRRPAVPPEEVLERVLLLREALYPVLLGTGSADDWRLVSTVASAARAAMQLFPATGGIPAGWRFSDPGREDLTLLAVADAAADLLTSPAGGFVAACPGTGCGWLFTDPRRRRRWCSMAWCGNRAKARRHAQRRAAATA